MSFATCIVAPAALRDDAVTLEGETFHHLFRVRRFGPGQQLRLVDGRGSARWGRVESVESGEAVVRLGAEAESNEAGFRLELWVAPARPQRAAWLVEKATEIGVAAIRWLDSDRVGRQVPATRLSRLRRVAEAAVEQCHRASVPEITGLHSWQESIDCIAASGASWFLDIAGRSTIDAASGESGALFVGPEGGWSDRERDDLAGAGCRPVGLGPRHLRLETAAIAGCALILSTGGD